MPHLVGPHAAHGGRKSRVAVIYHLQQLLTHLQRQHHGVSDGIDLPTSNNPENTSTQIRCDLRWQPRHYTTKMMPRVAAVTQAEESRFAILMK